MQYKKVGLMVLVLLAVLSVVAMSSAQSDAPTPDIPLADEGDDPLAIGDDGPLAGDGLDGAATGRESEAVEPMDLAELTAPAATGGLISSAFVFSPTAQMRLNNQVVNGNCDATFNLYNASSGGTLMGGPLNQVIAVSNGRFTTALDFGASKMDGEERWVEMAVRCPPGSGSYTTITPRRYLTAVPYAQGLRPGARVIGFTDSTAGTFYVRNTSTGYNDRGIVGVVDCDDLCYGILGIATATSGRTRGVTGDAHSPEGYGGIFTNSAVGGVGLYARSGHQYTADIVLGANGADDDGVISSDPSQVWSDFIAISRDKAIVGVGWNGVNNGDSYFEVRHRSGRALLRTYPSGRTAMPVLQITGGSDLSEQFDVQAYRNRVRPAPGMVVCIDAANPGELVVCGQAYSTVVAGVISGAGGVQPGMVMGQEGTAADGEHPVALTGRVYVQVDASQGAIRPGDLLTTSATPGHAMKAADRDRAQGAILGKAMTALDSGTGLVLVLVSLQ